MYQRVKSYTMLTEPQFISLCSFFRQVPANKTVVIAGTYRGGDAMAMRLIEPNTNIIVIDSFKGLQKPSEYDHKEYTREGLFACSLDKYLEGFTHLGITPPDQIYEQFITSKSLEPIRVDDLALLWMDLDQYEPTKAILAHFLPQISKDTIILTHDYGFGHTPGVKQACDEFSGQWIHQNGISQFIR